MTILHVNSFLNKEISKFQSATKSVPTGITSPMAFLNGCKNGKYREQVERLRAETDEKKRDALKKQLPAVTLQSEPCDKRSKESCKNNGILILDIDNVENVADAKQRIAKLPYVAAVFISAGGNGLCVVCALAKPTEDLKPIIKAMQQDIPYPIDMSGSDVSRLRFATYDPDMIIAKIVTPFELHDDDGDDWATMYQAEYERDDDSEVRIARGKKYVAKMPPSISRQKGHNDLFRAANAMHDLGLTEDEAFTVIKESFNPLCQPGWEDKDIRHKIDEAFTKPIREHGSRLQKSESLSLPTGRTTDDSTNSQPLPYTPFPVDALPSALRNFVMAGAKSLGCDPAYFATPILPIVASFIGSRYVLVVKNDWFIPAILWMFIVSESGGSKSPALKPLLEPLKVLQDIAFAIYVEAMKTYRRLKKCYEADLAQWRKDRQKGKDTKPPVEPIPPQLVEYFVEDSTTEALIDVLSRNADGVLGIHDELAGTFYGSFNAYRGGSKAGNKDESLYNRCFDGGLVKINRKTADKKVLVAHHTHTSMTGGIQPDALRDISAKNTSVWYSGQFARSLFAMPPDNIKTFSELVIPESIKSGYNHIFETLIGWRDCGDIMSPGNPYHVKLSDGAKELFIENHDAFEAERYSESGVMKSHLSKMKDITGRIALVLHIVECVSQHTSEGFTGTIPPVEKETMANAIRIARWFSGQTRRLFQLMRPKSEVESDREAMKILQAIDKKGSITKAELLTLYVFKTAKNPSDTVEAKLTELRKQGLIVADFVKDPKGGRGKEVYRRSTNGGSGTTIIPSKTRVPRPLP